MWCNEIDILRSIRLGRPIEIGQSPDARWSSAGIVSHAVYRVFIEDSKFWAYDLARGTCRVFGSVDPGPIVAWRG